MVHQLRYERNHFTQRPLLMFCRPSDTSSHPSSRCVPGARPAIQPDLPMRLPSPLPPMFPHHGLSCSILRHQNGFGTRGTTNGCSGERKSKRQTEMGPYGGISNPVAIEPLPHRRSRVSSPVPPEPGHPSVNKKAEWNEKTFPRMGDITDLRDPQVARLDQAFSNYPLWTIQKVIFVCSMDNAARGRTPLARNSAKDAAVSPSLTKDSETETSVAVPDDLSTLESPFIPTSPTWIWGE